MIPCERVERTQLHPSLTHISVSVTIEAAYVGADLMDMTKRQFCGNF